jgi:hypothetical protein
MTSPIRALSLLVPLALILPAAPALAKVLAEGPAKGGFFWQKIETNSGTDARAVKPE